MNNEFWLKNPSILFNKDQIHKLWPSKSMNYPDKLNAVTRFIILVSVFGYMLINNYIIIVLGVILILLIVFVYNKYINDYLENFSTLENNDKDKHTSKNPLYNVLLTDYDDNVDKPQIKDEYTEIKEENINDKVKEFIYDNNKNNKDIKKIFNNLANNFEFENSMRQFHINPSTTIPNNQDDFLNYCYSNLYSEKNVIEY